MTNLKAWLAALLLAAFSLSPALAEEKKDEKKPLIPGTFSANAGLYSDYTFRGITQTGNKPAFQGGIDWSIDTGMHGVGVYAGLWGSNVDFGDGNRATAEIDFYGGLTRKFGPVDAKAGFIYYRYPGAAGRLNYDYVEGMLGLSTEIMDGLTVGVTYNGSPDNFGASGTAHYFNGGVSYKVPVKVVDVTLYGNIGHQSIQKNTVFGTPDYWDFKVGGSLALTPNVAVNVFYTDTDISTARCVNGSNNCDGRGQVSLVATF